MQDDEIMDIIIEQCNGDKRLMEFCEHLFDIESSPDTKYNAKYDNLLKKIIADG